MTAAIFVCAHGARGHQDDRGMLRLVIGAARWAGAPRRCSSPIRCTRRDSVAARRLAAL
jgi:hypothetical protein